MNVKDTLPKSGHVNEVCKEWLVREDGALAYRLQSQEINEFYQGNKFRNAVVRQDFPTALNEQIKEQETAEQEAARYHQLLKEQEEADKLLAEEIANKLKFDEKKHFKQLEENELVARQIQENYVNLNSVGIPIASTDEFFLPPRNIVENEHNHSRVDSFDDNDVICDRFQKINCRPIPAATVRDLCNDIHYQDQYNHHHHHRQNYDQYFDTVPNLRTPEVYSPTNSMTDATVNFTFPKNVEYENCRPQTKLSPPNLDICSGGHDIDDVPSWQDHQHNPRKQGFKLSTSAIKKPCNVMDNSLKVNVPPSPDDIRNYNELGLSPEDFVELSKKIEQEKSDEELARYLQEEEQKRNLSQEEKDRLLAIEAQDKELALMLQEKEKLRLKRAREKARLKKLQAKELTDNSKLPIVNEPYSDPRDLIIETQQHQHLTDTHNSSRYKLPPTMNENFVDETAKTHNSNNEDIYTLPIDNTNNSEINNAKESEEMNASITSHSSRGSNSRKIPHSPTDLVINYYRAGTETSPKPPYMPIHEIGNNMPVEGKKKKSKDKCTHQ